MDQVVLPGSKVIKVTGILMMISGALSAPANLMSKATVSAVAILLSGFNAELESAVKRIGSIYTFLILLSLLVLAVGIAATVQAGKPVNPLPLVTMCLSVTVISVVLNVMLAVAANAFAEAAGTPISSIGSLIVGVISSAVLPTLCVVGCFQKKKALSE